MKTASIFHTRSFVTFLLCLLFFTLHHFIFLKKVSGSIPVISSYVDAPVDWPPLALNQITQPNYLHPLRPVTYEYWVLDYDPNTDPGQQADVVIEQASSLLHDDLTSIQGDVSSYWDADTYGPHMRPLVPFEYANAIFFLVQYLILLSIAIVITRNRLSNRFFKY